MSSFQQQSGGSGNGGQPPRKILKDGKLSKSLKGLPVHTCDRCGQVLTRNEHLGRHMRIHTGKRPYICRFCDLGFPRKDSHDKHVQRTHQDELVSAATDANQPSFISVARPAMAPNMIPQYVPVLAAASVYQNPMAYPQVQQAQHYTNSVPHVQQPRVASVTGVPTYSPFFQANVNPQYYPQGYAPSTPMYQAYGVPSTQAGPSNYHPPPSIYGAPLFNTQQQLQSASSSSSSPSSLEARHSNTSKDKGKGKRRA